MKSKKYSVSFTLISVFAFLLSSVNFATAEAETDIPKLTLSAQATIDKPADELHLKIGVINLNETAEVALAENSAKMQKVMADLEAAGLTKKDYETGQFSIHPTYTPYPSNPPYDWKPSINGYEVSNTINIHTDKLDSAGKIIDVANKAGANSINDVHFGLHNPRLYWSEALSAATAHAISDAQSIAAAANVSLVRILSITLNTANVCSPPIDTAFFAKGAGSTPAIEPGDVHITASVTLVYEIYSGKK